VELHFARFAIASLNRVDDSRADVGTDREAVDQYEDRLLEVEFEKRLRRRELHNLALAFGARLVQTVVAAAPEFRQAVLQRIR
jgi:hypothetical protein